MVVSFLFIILACILNHIYNVYIKVILNFAFHNKDIITNAHVLYPILKDEPDITKCFVNIRVDFPYKQVNIRINKIKLINYVNNIYK